METGKRHPSDKPRSNGFASAAQEVRGTWNFARQLPLQSGGQPPSDTSFGHDMSLTDKTISFSFSRRSQDATTRCSDEEILARRHESRKATRLLNPNIDTGRKPSCAVPEVSLPAHTPIGSASLREHDHFSLPSGSCQSHSSNQKIFVPYSESPTMAPRHHSPTKPRKSFSERLREPPKPPSLHDTSDHSSHTQNYEAALMNHDSKHSLPVIDNDMTRHLPGSENVSVPNSNMNLRSRSVSVSSSTLDSRGMQGVVMEAMNTIQRFESENETQKREIERLTAHGDLLEKENDKLDKKVQFVKKTSLQKLSASSQNLETLRLDLAALKSESLTLTFISPGEVQEMKAEIADALSASEKYFKNQGGESFSGCIGKTREIIAELKLDCVHKQQVLDMLRDRLTDALSDLAVSNNRVLELEEAYAADKLALTHVTDQLTTTGSRISELASALKQQQKESLDAIVLAGNFEQQLEASRSEVSRLSRLVEDLKIKVADSASLQAQVSQMESLVEHQTSKLKSLESASQENIQLKYVAEENNFRVSKLEASLSDFHAIREQNIWLEVQLEDRERKRQSCETELSALVVVKDSAVSKTIQLETRLEENLSKSMGLEFEVLAKSELIEELKISLGVMQANFEASCQSIKKLEGELALSLARESSCHAAESAGKAQRLEEQRAKTLSEEKLVVTERKLQDLAVQAAMHERRYSEVNARLQSLQDRFEEQSVTLRLTRDTSAELQDRLTAAELSYAKELETKSSDLRTQIAVLREQNISLQSQLEQSKSDTQRQHVEHTTKEAMLILKVQETGTESEAKCGTLRTEIAVLREQNSACRVQLEQSSSEFKSHLVECATKEAELTKRMEGIGQGYDRELRQANDLKIQADRGLAEALLRNSELESCLARVQDQLRAIPAPCTTHEEDITKLTTQLSTIRSERDTLKERTLSLNRRYDKGDLDPEERTLIKTVINATQSMHDHELAQAQNELNRCKRLIVTLQDSKASLENSLAKHLSAEAKLETKGGTSVMDFVHWPSSQRDASMECSVPPAQDKDEPSTAPEDPPTRGERDIIPVFAPIRVLDSPERPLATLVRISTPVSTGSNQNFAPPAGGRKNPYFSTLAPDNSDEIEEFQEETIRIKRKNFESEPMKPETSKPEKGTKMVKVSENQVLEMGSTKTTYGSKPKRKRR